MLSERQKKLDELVNEIDELFGVGNGYVDENTDVDKFIKDFIHEFTVNIRGELLFSMINENSNKTYKERFDEI